MYLRILKRDLRRRKTMNVILLLFTILAAMFVSSGLANVITAMNGTDYFFNQAGLKDYVVFTQGGDGGVPELLKDGNCVKSYNMENIIWTSNDDVTSDGAKLKGKNNTMVLQSLQKDEFRFFLTDNSELTGINAGDIYLTAGVLSKNDLKVGDELRLRMHDVDETFRIAGEIKDALLGSDMMGNTRLLISDEDFQKFWTSKELEPYQGRIFNIETDDTKALSALLTEAGDILFSSDRSVIKLSYVMDMIVAMIVMVLSICLIIVSFVILKFVITFSIQEEFREIGVMKAIGIRNGRIRRLYVTKYLAIAVTGGAIGGIAGVPFGRMLIRSVSEKMVLGSLAGYMINVVGVIVVAVLITGFAYLCTRRVKKLTPVDAIRSGQTGERYHKKSGCRISRSRLGTAFYMAVNDVFSAPGRYLAIVLTFFICSVLMLGIVLVDSTIRSKSMITCFGTESDVYITDSKLMKMSCMKKDGYKEIQKQYEDIKEKLDAAGMPVEKVGLEVWYKYSCEANGGLYSVIFQQNRENKTTDYSYIEGTAPENADEIAITPMIADELGVKIGDTIIVDFGTEKRKCVITALFQSMNQLGKVARLHEDAPTDMEYANAMMAFQVDFADAPDEGEIENRVGKIKELYGITGVFDAANYCVDCMGVADTMDAVAVLLLFITAVVVVLVTVLMERTFQSAEFGQIALLKAIGFTDRTVITWHVSRFMLVAAVPELLAVILSVPVTKLWCDPIWNMMGASDVSYHFDPVKMILIYPGIILVITFAAAWLTALKTKKIHGTDLVNVE